MSKSNRIQTRFKNPYAPTREEKKKAAMLFVQDMKVYKEAMKEKVGGFDPCGEISHSPVFWGYDENGKPDPVMVGFGDRVAEFVGNHSFASYRSLLEKRDENQSKCYASFALHGVAKKLRRSYIGQDVAHARVADRDESIYQSARLFTERLEDPYFYRKKKLLCSYEKDTDWAHLPFEEAMTAPYIQVNNQFVSHFLIVDVDNCDGNKLYQRFKQLGVYPHFMVGKAENFNSWHLYFGLSSSVFRTHHLTQRVQLLLTILFFGDFNYTNICAKNPISPYFDEYSVCFDLANYDLVDLKRRIDEGIKALPQRERKLIEGVAASESRYNPISGEPPHESKLGRNCRLFYELGNVAYHYAQGSRVADSTCENYQRSLKKHLENHYKNHKEIAENGNGRLPISEIKSTIKSVVRYYSLRRERLGKGRFASVNKEKALNRARFVNFFINDSHYLAKLRKKVPASVMKEWADMFEFSTHKMRSIVQEVRKQLGIKLLNKKDRPLPNAKKLQFRLRAEAFTNLKVTADGFCQPCAVDEQLQLKRLQKELRLLKKEFEAHIGDGAQTKNDTQREFCLFLKRKGLYDIDEVYNDMGRFYELKEAREVLFAIKAMMVSIQNVKMEIAYKKERYKKELQNRIKERQNLIDQLVDCCNEELFQYPHLTSMSEKQLKSLFKKWDRETGKGRWDKKTGTMTPQEVHNKKVKDALFLISKVGLNKAREALLPLFAETHYTNLYDKWLRKKKDFFKPSPQEQINKMKEQKRIQKQADLFLECFDDVERLLAVSELRYQKNHHQPIPLGFLGVEAEKVFKNCLNDATYLERTKNKPEWALTESKPKDVLLTLLRVHINMKFDPLKLKAIGNLFKIKLSQIGC